MFNNLAKIHQQLFGYIRRCTLNEEDYNILLNNFKKIINNLSYQYNEDYMQKMYYRIDIMLLEFYTNYKMPRDRMIQNRVKLKVRQLYEKLKSGYPEMGVKTELEKYSLGNNSLSILELKNYFSIIIDSGYPHVVLAFFYMSVLNDIKIEFIINELSKRNLDNIYDLFVNYYSEEAGLPTFITVLLTTKLKEKLNRKLRYLIYKNDGITPKKLQAYLDFLTGNTILEIYFGKNKELDISLWSDKTRRKVLNKLLKNLIMGV